MTATKISKKNITVMSPPKAMTVDKEKYHQKRVAAYCRVSTDSEEQLTSYTTQKKVYTEMIAARPDWELAGIYADEGISGTRADKRPQFQKMIKDCFAGKIDYIVTKSVSRFARNTVDCLEHVRILKNRGIGIFFEEQNIDTLSIDSELYLVIYAGFAQSESESMSKNITWAYRKRFEDGKVLMQYKSMLGYRKGADGEPEIVPEEAKIVTRIFDMFLSGQTVRAISEQLRSEKIHIPGKNFSFSHVMVYNILRNEKYCIFDMFLSGQTVRAISEQLRSEKIHIPGKNFSFSHVMVYNILRNEKYCGDSILQKTITVDCISKTRRDNMGEAPMYYVQNSHPAIISRETYHMTQAEIARRKTLAPASEKKAVTVAGKYSKYALSEVLVCGECGSRYRRVTWTSGGKRVVWRCSNRLENGKKYCKMSLTVKEESLHAAIVRAINKFNSQDHAAYLALMKATIGEALGIQAETAEIDELKRRIDALNQKMVSIIQKAARDGEDIEEHESEFKEMAESIALFKQRISVLEQAKRTDAEMSERMAKIQEIIDERQAHQDVYDDSIVRQMIECIKVFSNGNIEVYFGGGNCIHETIAFD